MLVLPPARDHKRVGDGDTGPEHRRHGRLRAGRAGRAPRALLARVEREILRPTLEGMRAEGRPFRGALFAGLMITPEGEPFLLEHNVRFGDPECEVLHGAARRRRRRAARVGGARRARSVGVAAVAEGRHALALVLAAAGYPAAPRAGDVITGLDRAGGDAGRPRAPRGHGAARDGAMVTAGGRVLAVTATGASLDEARARAYRAAGEIHFDGMHYRRDIGLPHARKGRTTMTHSVLIVMGSDSDFDQTAAGVEGAREPRPSPSR